MPRRRDQKGIRLNPLLSQATGKLGDGFLRLGYHKPGPEPTPGPGPGPEPPLPITCPCNAFRIADWRYREMTKTDRLPWRQALKKRKMSGYDLWMKECIVALMREGVYPSCPSVSGGFSCRHLQYSEDRPTPENTIGLAPEPEEPPEEVMFCDDFNRPDAPNLGENWDSNRWTIWNSRARIPPFSGNAPRVALYPQFTLTNEHDVRVLGANQWAPYGTGVFGSGHDNENGYSARRNGSWLQLFEITAGIYNYKNAVNIGTAPGYAIGLQASGIYIHTWYDNGAGWRQGTTVTRNPLLYGIQVGLDGRSHPWSGFLWADDWCAGDLHSLLPEWV